MIPIKLLLSNFMILNNMLKNNQQSIMIKLKYFKTTNTKN